MSAIVHYSAVNKLVLLTSHTLIGNYDAAVLRYMLLIAEFVDLVEWQTVEDFRAFAAVIYPTLTVGSFCMLFIRNYIIFLCMTSNHI